MYSQVHQLLESLVYENEDVTRKVEYDWNMAYLARQTNESISTISKGLFDNFK